MIHALVEVERNTKIAVVSRIQNKGVCEISLHLLIMKISYIIELVGISDKFKNCKKYNFRTKCTKIVKKYVQNVRKVVKCS